MISFTNNWRHAAGGGVTAALLAACALAAAPNASRATGLFSSGPSHAAAQKTASATATTLAAQIRQALDERRYVDAGDLLDQAERLKITSPEFDVLKGNLLLARARFAEALASFRLAIGAPDAGAEAQQGMGLALSQLDRSDEALAALQTAVQKDKTLWRAWNALGCEYDLRRQWKQAQAAYTVALAAPGADKAIVLNNRGYSHLLQKEMDLASADFVAALDRNPALASARTNLRITLALQGAYARASSTGVGDDRAAVLNNVGLTAAMRGDYMQAEKLLNEAIAAKGQYYARAAENLQLSHDLAAESDEKHHSALGGLRDSAVEALSG